MVLHHESGVNSVRRRYTGPASCVASGHKGAVNSAMSTISRREFLERSGAGLAAAASPVPVVADGSGLRSEPASASASSEPTPVPRTNIRVMVNGVERRLDVDDRWTLVELLRDHL